MRASVDGLDSLLHNISLAEQNVRDNATRAAAEIAVFLEAWAKTHHKWVRDSGLTDATTRAQIETVSEQIVTVVLSAGMEYDVHLEMAAGGAFAWIRPAVVDNRVHLIEIVRRWMGV